MPAGATRPPSRANSLKTYIFRDVEDVVPYKKFQITSLNFAPPDLTQRVDNRFAKDSKGKLPFGGRRFLRGGIESPLKCFFGSFLCTQK